MASPTTIAPPSTTSIIRPAEVATVPPRVLVYEKKKNEKAKRNNRSWSADPQNAHAKYSPPISGVRSCWMMILRTSLPHSSHPPILSGANIE